MTFTFYWHDYETWGSNPRWDRPAQFAGRRTDPELNPIGKPLVRYCAPPDDLLPHPEACLITGITPQLARNEGICEAEFFAEIERELSRPNTCAVGYNSLRFDDEVTRYGLYRNLYDPYAREWRNGNSRWDLIDVVRLTHALRPEGIEWPQRPDGTTSFRLEELTQANGLSHAAAHDALSDVDATIALARLIRQRQPRLFDYLLNQRSKAAASALLNLQRPTPLLHVSAKYPASRGCIALIVPLARHPINSNAILVYDLRYDPTPLLELSAAALRERLFTPNQELPEGVERIPVKGVHLNKCPILVPPSTLRPDSAERWGIDLQQGERHWQHLQRHPELATQLQEAFNRPFHSDNSDPEGALYAAFIGERDRTLLTQVHTTPPAKLAALGTPFQDPRLNELLFRYRARNYPTTLTPEERQRWERYRHERLHKSVEIYGISLHAFRQNLARLMIDPKTTPEQRAILSQLADWPAEIGLDPVMDKGEQ